MSNKEYSIHDKMLIRSLAEFSIETPYRFMEIFKSPDDVLTIFPELQDVLDYMYNTVEFDNSTFQQLIYTIPNSTTKAIFSIVLDGMEKNDDR